MQQVWASIGIVAASAAMAWCVPARASGDITCEPSWTLDHRQLSGCDNMALLGPGNDTRVNLTLLMRDLQGPDAPLPAPPAPPASADGVPPPPPGPLFDWYGFKHRLFPRAGDDGSGDYADGEGSRCRSNDSGAAAFAAAVAEARKLSPAEREALTSARTALQPSCAGPSAGGDAVAAAAAAMRSAEGKAFARYLQGARAFYDADYDTAAGHFAALSSAGSRWLKEAGRYMAGRVEVNRAQIDAFDDYGYPKDAATADARTIDAALAALNGYLKAYPKGQYAASARGLLRRVYWLGGRTDRLAADYAALMPLGAARGLDDAMLAQEIDNKLLPRVDADAIADPVLLAVIGLARMRKLEEWDRGCCGGPLTRQALDAQKPRFARAPALFDYLRAAHAWYVESRPADVLAIIPETPTPRRFTSVEFSRQMLRGMALEATGDARARSAWLAMLPAAQAPWQREAAELALALHDERAAPGAVSILLQSGSPVRTPAIREILLAHVADAATLRRQAQDGAAPAHERSVALFTLLYKQLTRGAYRGFLADLALVPAGAPAQSGLWGFPASDPVPLGMLTAPGNPNDYDCPALPATVRTLAATPKDAGARLCLAEFVRVNGFDDFVLDTPPPARELGGTPSRFPGGTFSRLELYKALIADPATPAAHRAYALYRAVQCYGPSGNNSCGGVEVPVETRRAWFQRLKRDHTASPWAKAARYYW